MCLFLFLKKSSHHWFAILTEEIENMLPPNNGKRKFLEKPFNLFLKPAIFVAICLSREAEGLGQRTFLLQKVQKELCPTVTGTKPV